MEQDLRDTTLKHRYDKRVISLGYIPDDYEEYLRSLECCVCGRTGSDPTEDYAWGCDCTAGDYAYPLGLISP